MERPREGFALAIRGFGPLDSVLIQEDLREQTGKVVLVTGPHAAGKSSVLAAIEWALRGKCRGVAFKREGAQFLVRDGAKQAEVRLQLRSLDVRRVLDRAGDETLGLDGRLGPGVREPQAELDQQLGPVAQAVPYLIDGLRWLDEPADVRARVVVALTGKPPIEEIMAGFGARQLVSEDALFLAQVYAEHGHQRACAAAVELRRSAKRDHQAADEAIRMPAEKYEEPGFSINLAKVTLAQLQGDKAQLDAQANRKILEAATAGGQRAAIEAQLAELKSHPPASEIEDPAPIQACLTDLHRDAALLQVQVAETRQKLQDAQRGPIGPPGIPDPENPPECPLLGVQCVASAVRIRDAQRRGVPNPPPAGEPGDELAQQLDVTTSLLGKRRSQIADLEAKLRDLDAQAARRTAHHERLRAVEAALAKLPAPVAPEQVHEQKQLAHRIERAVRVLAAKQAFDHAVDAARRAAGERMSAARKVAECEQLVAALEPDQIPAELRATALGPLRNALAESTAIGLPEVQLRDDLSLEVIVGGLRRHEASLSGSERQRLGWVVGAGLGALARWPLICIDELALLVPAQRPKIIDWALRMSADRNGIAIVALAADAAPKLPFALLDHAQVVHLG